MRAIAAAVLFLAGLGGAASASDFSAHPHVPADVRGIALAAARDFHAGRYDGAAAKYQAIVDRHSDCIEAWSDLGTVRSQEGRLDEAIRAFRRAARLDPQDAAVQTDLGMCYFEQGKYSAAIPSLERAERLNPDNSNVHACLARCYEKTGRRDDSEQERQTENLQQMNTFR